MADTPLYVSRYINGDGQRLFVYTFWFGEEKEIKLSPLNSEFVIAIVIEKKGQGNIEAPGNIKVSINITQRDSKNKEVLDEEYFVVNGEKTFDEFIADSMYDFQNKLGDEKIKYDVDSVINLLKTPLENNVNVKLSNPAPIVLYNETIENGHVFKPESLAALENFKSFGGKRRRRKSTRKPRRKSTRKLRRKSRRKHR